MEYQQEKLEVSNKQIWQEAMKYGAILGAVTIIAELLIGQIQSLLIHPGSLNLMGTIPAFFLNIGKTVLFIYLRVVFARRLINGFTGVMRNHVFRFGTCTSLFSSLIVSAWQLVQLKLIAAAKIEEAMEEALASMPQANAAQAEAVINSIMPSLPLLMFIFKFLICFVIGIIAALVISRSIKGVSDNPFGSN